jgi:serine-type D-Ala-D-Ala carboxypeptidase (penicillin-binding protein 5/6)
MRDPVFQSIVRAKRASVVSKSGPLRVVQNRNVLLWLYRGAIGVKTGFTTPAGYCVVAVAQRGGVRLLAVVLGAPDDAFSDAAALLNYGFASFRRAIIVSRGQRLGVLTVGEQTVTVVAGDTLAPLVPVARGAGVRVKVREATSFPTPVTTGERIGTVIASLGGTRLGSVPALARIERTAHASGPPGAAGPWADPIQAAAGVLAGFARAVFGGFL